MTDRRTAWNFKGAKCPRCGFKGALLYVETCDNCGGSLIDCPKCKSVECLSRKSDSGTRDPEKIREAMIGLQPRIRDMNKDVKPSDLDFFVRLILEAK